jgi:hypothetical protein
MRRLALLAVPLVFAVPLALATTTATDPNDVSGKLDFKKAVAVRDGKVLRFTLTTYDAWASKILQGRFGASRPAAGPNAMTVLYDVNRDGRADYTGRIVYFQKYLGLWISGVHRMSNFEPLPVKRPTAKSASFIHPVDIFWSPSTGTKTLGIAVTSRYGGARDRIPNHGWMKVVYHLG